MRVWLITWEYAGDPAKIKKPVAAILSGRYSPERVRLLVEQMYINQTAIVSEHIAYARNKKNNPYPAYYTTYKGADVTWKIYCGHHPYLYARLAFDLKLEEAENGKQRLSWQEYTNPNGKWISRSLEIPDNPA